MKPRSDDGTMNKSASVRNYNERRRKRLTVPQKRNDSGLRLSGRNPERQMKRYQELSMLLWWLWQHQ